MRVGHTHSKRTKAFQFTTSPQHKKREKQTWFALTEYWYILKTALSNENQCSFSHLISVPHTLVKHAISACLVRKIPFVTPWGLFNLKVFLYLARNILHIDSQTWLTVCPDPGLSQNRGESRAVERGHSTAAADESLVVTSARAAASVEGFG